ncbi:RDD family protein [Pseudomonas sp. 3A(2025)]
MAAWIPGFTLKHGFTAAVFLAAAYFLLADALPGGQSLGKRLLSIAVVDRKTFKACTPGQSFTRNSGTLIVLDWIWIFMEARMRLGDMFAKTIVIQTGKLRHQVRGLSDIYHG